MQPRADLAGGGQQPTDHPRPVAERRLTTILFADLVGFTPLSESRDAEQVRELLSRYFAVARTVVARYGGTVEKFIGDAVMAVWGVPVAHEDDAERAVRAGLDLADAVSALGDEVGADGLSMRVGLVTGEVAVTLGATGEGMVAGDPVNTAARIQTAAAPGEVWVDDTTRALTSAAVVYADAGSHALKGKSEPVTLFIAQQVVATVGGAQRVDGLEAPFVGRDREMRLVKELFHATLEEDRPRLVAVYGQPGIGKSRLGWEFFKYIDGISVTVRWHRGRCLSYGDGVAFWALAEIVRSRFDILEGDEAVVVVEKLDAGLQTWVADPDERSWLRPRLGALLGVAEQVGGDAAPSSDELLASWQLFFERLSHSGEAVGVALLIEDVQWADDGLLDFIELLVERSQAPIFILALARSELAERRPTWASGRRATAIHLEPLPPAKMSELVEGLVDGLSAETNALLVERAEGVPLFAVETIRALIDRDQVVPREGRYVVAESHSLDLDSVGAPTSLQTLLAARLDALPPVERTAMQNASVLGLSFTRAGLLALSHGTAEADIDAALAALVRKELLSLDTDPRSPERGQYRFVQAMVRGVAYETLSRRDRKARHLLAAEHLAHEPDADAYAGVLAHHYLDARAAMPDDPDGESLTAQAVALLERAAVRARSLGSPSQAVRHYVTALPFAADDVTTGELAVGAASASLAAGRSAEALELAEQAASAFERAGRRVQWAHATSVVGECINNSGNVGDMPERLIAVYESLEENAETRRVMAKLAQQIGRAFFAGRADGASGAIWADRATVLADAEEDPLLLAESISGYAAILMTTRRPTMGLGMLRVALEVARDNDLPRAQLIPLNNLASFLAGRDLAKARGYAEEGLALAQRLGDGDTGGYLAATRAFIYWLGGQWDELTDDVQLSGMTADHFLSAVFGVYRGLALHARGEPVPAPEVDYAHITSTQMRSAALTGLSLHLLSTGDDRGGLKAALEALDTYFDFGGFDDDFPTYWCALLDAAMQVQDLEVADRWLRRVADAPRGQLSGVLRALVPYFRARMGILTNVDAALVDADFDSAAGALRAFGTPYWHGRCLLDQAEWRSNQGRVADATPLLDAAEGIFTSLRAAPFIERVRRARALAVR
ncbi:MAG TPA: adenylate/guanylate cyclase domain-containing protein [Mycobacteriales bacterium]|nr:adenylate/guanylate cyclase domain-containing protein [Mycobacteriales bacterium]